MATYRYKLIAGGHRDVDGRDYVKGDTITTSRPLDEVFGKTKFQKIKEPEKNLKLTKPKKKVEPIIEEEQESLDGTDVTVNFPLASVNDFLVSRKGRWHYVYDKKDVTVPLNEKGLSSKDVSSFVHDLLE